MVPHAGTDSDLFRSVTALGDRMRELAFVAGRPRVKAPVAIVFDWVSWWASEQDSHPTERLRFRQEALDWYTALLDLGMRADVVPVWASLAGYPVVIAPILHVVPAALRDRLQSYVDGGGHLITTYFSGIVDENDHVWLGGYPGALRSLLGIRIEEFAPLLDGEQVELDTGSPKSNGSAAGGIPSPPRCRSSGPDRNPRSPTRAPPSRSHFPRRRGSRFPLTREPALEWWSEVRRNPRCGRAGPGPATARAGAAYAGADLRPRTPAAPRGLGCDRSGLGHARRGSGLVRGEHQLHAVAQPG
jgi:hypothetical protein